MDGVSQVIWRRIVAGLCCLILVNALQPDLAIAETPSSPALPTVPGLEIRFHDAAVASVPEELVEALAVASSLQDSHPNDFGKAHIKGSEVLLPIVKGSDGSAILSRETIAASGREKVAYSKIRSGLAGHSYAQLREDADRLGSLLQGWQSSGTDLDSTWVSEDGRLVALMRAVSIGTGTRIVDEFGAGNVIVEVAPNLGVGEAGFSRQDDTGSVHWGASRIVSSDGSYWCSSAFMGNSGKSDGVITAGHCSPNGEGLKWPNGDPIQVYATTRENYNVGVGTVRWNSTGIFAGDLAWGYNRSTNLGRAHIYIGGVNSAVGTSVGGVWTRNSVNGDQYCIGGARTGETCGWKVYQYDIRYYYYNSDGSPAGSVYPVTRGHKTSGTGHGGGDSGGAVYTVDSGGKAWAKGVHSGGVFASGPSKNPATCTTSSPCVEVFTEMYWASKVFPGAVMTE